MDVCYTSVTMHDLKILLYEMLTSEDYMSMADFMYSGYIIELCFSLIEFDKQNPEHIDMFEIKDLYYKMYAKAVEKSHQNSIIIFFIVI